MLYTMRLDKKFKSAFNYLVTKMKVKKLPIDLNKVKWEEGNSYDWAVFEYKNVQLIIRKYQAHFTFFTKFSKEIKEDKNFIYKDVKYGCFTYQIDRDKLTDKQSDSYYDNPFQDLNKRILSIVDEIEEGHIHGLWNPYSATIETDDRKGHDNSLYRPEYVKMKTIWTGSNDDVCSIDDFIFACEELFSKYLEKFATNDLLEKLKTFKVGDKIGKHGYEILKIVTDVKDDYYHAVGLELKGTNGKDSKSWQDVYSLSRYYLEDVYNGEVPLYSIPNKKKNNKVIFDRNDF